MSYNNAANLTLHNRFTNLFSTKTKKNFQVSIVPFSYFNIHLLHHQFAHIIPPQQFDNEVGFAKFDMNTYIFNSNLKGSLLRKRINMFDISQSENNSINGELICYVNFPIYLPLHNKQIACDDKNVNSLSFSFLESMQCFFLQYNAEMGVFENPVVPEHIYKLIYDKTVPFLSYLLNKAKLGKYIDKELQKIVANEDFKNFNINLLPMETDFESFMSLPNSEKYSEKDLEFLKENTINADYMNRFLTVASKMF